MGQLDGDSLARLNIQMRQTRYVRLGGSVNPRLRPDFSDLQGLSVIRQACGGPREFYLSRCPAKLCVLLNAVLERLSVSPVSNNLRAIKAYTDSIDFTMFSRVSNCKL